MYLRFTKLVKAISALILSAIILLLLPYFMAMPLIYGIDSDSVFFSNNGERDENSSAKPDRMIDPDNVSDDGNVDENTASNDDGIDRNALEKYDGVLSDIENAVDEAVDAVEKLAASSERKLSKANDDLRDAENEFEKLLLLVETMQDGAEKNIAVRLLGFKEDAVKFAGSALESVKREISAKIAFLVEDADKLFALLCAARDNVSSSVRDLLSDKENGIVRKCEALKRAVGSVCPDGRTAAAELGSFLHSGSAPDNFPHNAV